MSRSGCIQGNNINVGGDAMASGKDYLEYILGQLSGLDDISYRAMMGEYIIYYCGKVVGSSYYASMSIVIPDLKSTV